MSRAVVKDNALKLKFRTEPSWPAKARFTFTTQTIIRSNYSAPSAALPDIALLRSLHFYTQLETQAQNQTETSNENAGIQN